MIRATTRPLALTRALAQINNQQMFRLFSRNMIRSKTQQVIQKMARALPITLAAITLFSAAAPSIRAQSAPPSQHDTQSATAEPQPVAKKVWTNDDLTNSPELASSPASSRPSPARSAHASRKNAAWYRAQLSVLQAKIPPLDNQIETLQSAIDGKPTGDAKKSVRPYGVRANDWSVELADLKQKRDDIAAKINELRDEARHNGVPASALP